MFTSCIDIDLHTYQTSLAQQWFRVRPFDRTFRQHWVYVSRAHNILVHMHALTLYLSGFGIQDAYLNSTSRYVTRSLDREITKLFGVPR